MSAPRIRAVTVDEVFALARTYYAKDGNGAGGSLHIVLDDGNLEDGSVRFCRQWAEERGDVDGVALAEALLALSRTQREKLYSRYREYSGYLGWRTW